MNEQGSSDIHNSVSRGPAPILLGPVPKGTENLEETLKCQNEDQIVRASGDVPTSEVPKDQAGAGEADAALLQRQLDDSWVVTSGATEPLLLNEGKKTNTKDAAVEQKLLANAEKKKKKKKEKRFFVNQPTGEKVREEGHYPLDGSKYLSIFNFKNFPDDKDFRNYTKEDTQKLKQVFKQMGYITMKFEDLNRSAFYAELHKIRKMKALDDAKVLIIAIMSHGARIDGDHFVTSDDKSVSMDQVRAFFDDINCPQLKGKPKIFLASFCRTLGPQIPASTSAETEESQSEAPVDRESQNNVEIENVSSTEAESADLILLTKEDTDPELVKEILDRLDPSKVSYLISQLHERNAVNPQNQDLGGKKEPLPAIQPKHCNDMITLYSCKKGLTSARDPGVGTRFIDALCRSVVEHGWQYNLERLFADVEEKMRQGCPENCDSLEGWDPDKKTATFKTCYLF